MVYTSPRRRQGIQHRPTFSRKNVRVFEKIRTANKVICTLGQFGIATGFYAR